MSLKNILSFPFALFILFSCASHKDLIFEDEPESTDLISAFDLTDSRFEQFRTDRLESEETQTDKPSEVDDVAKTEVKKEEKIKKQEVPRVAPKEARPSDKEEPKIVVADEATVPMPKEQTRPIEDDEDFPVPDELIYPEEFEEYDRRSKAIWDKFEPNSYTNEVFVFRISYLGLNVGTVQLRTEPMTRVAGRDVFHFRAHMRSARYYRFIYELDDRLETYVDARTFLPVRYTLIQRESGQDVDDLQLFDYENLETHVFFKRVREDRVTEREETHPIPNYMQDSFSSLYFVRGLPLEVGDRYEFPVVTRGRLWLIELNVEKKEQIRVGGRWTDAIKINAVTRFPGVLERRGDINFWYSDDEVRRPLQFQADVRIGSIRGELIDYTPGTRAQVTPEDSE